MNLHPKYYIAIFCLLTSAITTANTTSSKVAKEKINDIESAIIVKVTQAYGGEALTSLKSITITEHNKSISSGQGESPKQPGFFRINEALTIDFEAKRKSLLSWRVSRTSKDLEKFIFDGKQGRIYDILNHKYSDEDWLTFNSTGGGITRRSDTIIARSLSDNHTKVSYQGEISYRGTVHQKLNAKIGAGAEYTLFIEKEFGVITKMLRQHPSAGEISYAFSNHRKTAGLTYAQDLNFTVGGQTRSVSLLREIKVNPSLIAPFKEPLDYNNWGELFDSSELTVNKVAPNVYHAGKDRSFTLFVDAGKYFIAAGGHDGIKEKFAAIQALEQIDKPLKYIISTHHHDEHLPALKEAVSLGAKIITVKAHQKVIQDSLSDNNVNNNEGNSEDNYDERIEVIIGQTSLGNGAVEVYDIATMHADNYLLVYVPSANLVFAEDHYETQLKTAVPRVHKDMVIFRAAMEELSIDVERLIDGHSPRQLSITEFKAATEVFKDITCPAGYQICQGG